MFLVALAGRILGVSVTVVVPEDIRAVKRDALIAYGATVIEFGRTSSERIGHAKELASNRGMVFIHPYDDRHVIAGQGTVAMEVLEQVPGVDVFVAPVGGGGLLAGCATYINEEVPSVEVWGAEPELANDTWQSMKDGTRRSIELPDTLADGARNLMPGELTFPIMRRTCRGVLLVTEDQIRETVKLLLMRVKVVTEPTGALAAAAVLFNGGLDGRTAVVVVSGGNADPDLIRECL
jgi:threonine dehydratase